MKVYLSGPMRNRPQYNFNAFERATQLLRDQGWEVVSPHEMDLEGGHVTVAYHYAPEGKTFTHVELNADFDMDEALGRDLVAVGQCEGVVCLPDWEESEGARIEVQRAAELGLELFVLAHRGQVTPIPYPLWVVDPESEEVA